MTTQTDKYTNCNITPLEKALQADIDAARAALEKI